MTTPGEPVGSLADEAARFAEAIGAWGRARAATAGEAYEAAPGAEGGGSCRFCPLCQGLELLRGARPEVYAHLGDAAMSLLAAAREALGEAPRAAGAPAPSPEGPPVQRIVVD